MIAKVVVMLAMLEAIVTAMPAADIAPYQPVDKSPYQPAPKEYKEPAKPYRFDYGVRDDYSGANYGHQEQSDGNAIQGSYQVALPDGRIQTVKYIADHVNGFQAEVVYEGEATYPKEEPKQQGYQSVSEPIYKSAPKPQYKHVPEQPIYSQAHEEPVYEDIVVPIYTQ